jgi:hypothetical protein
MQWQGYDASFSLNALYDKSVFVLTSEMACILSTDIETFLQIRYNSYGKTLFQWMHCCQTNTVNVQ